MTPSIADEQLRGDHEANTIGEPDALKGARPVRKGTERKGLATAPRSQSTLHLCDTGPNICDNEQTVIFRKYLALAQAQTSLTPILIPDTSGHLFHKYSG
jgi:hypothetical protein